MPPAADPHDLWREASLHLDLPAFVVAADRWLRVRLPDAGLAVWRLRRDGRTLTGTGSGIEGARGPSGSTGLADGTGAAAPPRRELADGADTVFARWLAAAPTAVCPAGAPAPPALAALLPTAPAADVVVVAVPGEPGAGAALLVTLPPGAAADTATRDLCAGLRAPFAAALANDRRLRELQALRRAAEADRSSLLTRLGRSQLSEPVVGGDGGLAPVMQRVEMVAGSDLPVLILGETGSGKEVVARAVHLRSRRADGPFTRVNCGAIPPELVDSELFGHEKGAFTGAAARRRGWFEQSDRGTLLLDEVADLPKAAQVRLLRVLQDGLITRVGGETPVAVDVRIIAATNADLPALVQRGAFRADLWYRLAVFPLVLPPLRERRQDIPALVGMLVRRASRHFGVRPPSATAADLALLAAYDWPGNVRELGSVIDRAVILGGGRRLEVAKALGYTGAGAVAVGPGTGNGAAAARGGFVAEDRAPGAGTPGDDGFLGLGGEPTVPRNVPTPRLVPLDEAIARHIRAALAATQGRIEGPYGAARLLGINPHTLRARMRKLGIDWKAFRGMPPG